MVPRRFRRGSRLRAGCLGHLAGLWPLPSASEKELISRSAASNLMPSTDKLPEKERLTEGSSICWSLAVAVAVEPYRTGRTSRSFFRLRIVLSLSLSELSDAPGEDPKAANGSWDRR